MSVLDSNNVRHKATVIENDNKTYKKKLYLQISGRHEQYTYKNKQTVV